MAGISRDDDHLLAQFRRGDEAAFELIYERHVPGVRSFCRHMLGSDDEAEDAVQQAFAAARRELGRDDREIRLEPWLYAITRNRCVSMLRARREAAPRGVGERKLRAALEGQSHAQGEPLFKRFTERAREVVVLAQEEARALKHDYIGTEHVLLGLLCEEEGLAARVLESLDITVERVRAQVVRIVGSGEAVTSGQIAFGPRARKVLELALREALSLGDNYVGTEHILLGLVRENEGVAARILLDFDADSEKVRNEVIRMLSGPGGRWHSGAGGPGPSLERIGLLDALLDGAGAPFRMLVDELEERLGRPADAGDLLVLLASVSEGIGERVLAALGIEVEAFTHAVDEARSGGGRSSLLPPAELVEECETIRAERIVATKAQEYAQATELRARERGLLEKALESVEQRQEEFMAEMRVRLGLAKP